MMRVSGCVTEKKLLFFECNTVAWVAYDEWIVMNDDGEIYIVFLKPWNEGTEDECLDLRLLYNDDIELSAEEFHLWAKK